MKQSDGVRVSAGSSAAQQAQRLSALAQSYRLEAERATAESGQYAAAAIAEPPLAKRLSPPTAHGYYLLPDRQWPGSKNAQLDLIVVRCLIRKGWSVLLRHPVSA